MKKLLIFTLLFSVLVNVYLIFLVKEFNRSLIKQGVNTFHIEFLLKSYRLKLSYENVEKIYLDNLPKEVSVASLQKKQLSDFDTEADDKALIVGETILYFKDGYFWGSKIERPKYYPSGKD